MRLTGRIFQNHSQNKSDTWDHLARIIYDLNPKNTLHFQEVENKYQKCTIWPPLTFGQPWISTFLTPHSPIKAILVPLYHSVPQVINLELPQKIFLSSFTLKTTEYIYCSSINWEHFRKLIHSIEKHADIKQIFNMNKRRLKFSLCQQVRVPMQT